MLDFFLIHGWSTLKKLIWLKAAALSKGILKTVTGNPIHITDALAKPAQALSVKLEPIQDLHGYDNPWPDGGGKNLFNKDAIEMDKWIDINSTTISSATGYAVTDYMPVTQGTIYYCGVKGSARSAYYDTNKNGIAYFAYNGGSAFTAQYTGFMRFTLYAVDMQALVSTLQFEKGNAATAWTPYSNICPIYGHTDADVTRTGVNVWDEEWEPGTFNASGEPTSSNVTMRSKDFLRVEKNITLIVVGPYNVDTTNQIVIRYYDANKEFVVGGSILKPGPFTVPNDSRIKYMRFAYRYYLHDSGGVYNHDVSVNYPSTATAYSPYVGTTYPIPLGQTVYGGTLDVLTGVLTVTWASVDLGTLAWGVNATSRFYNATRISNFKLASTTAERVTGLLCSEYPFSTNLSYSDSQDDFSMLRGNGAYDVIIKDTRYSSVADFKTAMSGVQLCYELAEPVIIPLTLDTPIELLEGENNVWSDGTITMTYLADGNASDVEALNILLGGRYVNNHEADEPTDREALDILLGR